MSKSFRIKILLLFLIAIGILTGCQHCGKSPEKKSPAVRKNAVVMGYLYAIYDKKHNMSLDDINYKALTHIIHGQAIPNKNGTITVSYPMLQHLKDGLIEKAHNNGVKILISVGGSDNESALAQIFSIIAHDEKLRETFASNLAKIVNSNGYDGADIDWEFPTINDTDAFTDLMRVVYKKIHIESDKIVMCAVSPGYWIDTINYREVATVVDYVFYMGYDWGVPSNGPMLNPRNEPHGYEFSTDGNRHRFERSIKGAINYMIESGCPANKIVLGMPFYTKPSEKAWHEIRDIWDKGRPYWKPHPEFQEVKINGEYWTTPESIIMKINSVLSPDFSVLKNSAVVAGVGFWELSYEGSKWNSQLQYWEIYPDLTNTILAWKDMNFIPVALSSKDMQVRVDKIVRLDGSESYDYDSNELTYRWILLDKPNGSNSELKSVVNEKTSFIPDVEGIYTIVLIVDDGFIASPARVLTLTAKNK